MSPAVPSRSDLLHELEPVVRQGLDRHLSAATEWFPHEYIPYEVGRNYVQEPWDVRHSELAHVEILDQVEHDFLRFYRLTP
jgi:acyl-[acyl-carrier-protein] desaturase